VCVCVWLLIDITLLLVLRHLVSFLCRFGSSCMSGRCCGLAQMRTDLGAM
jgi:hypothetical protein